MTTKHRDQHTSLIMMIVWMVIMGYLTGDVVLSGILGALVSIMFDVVAIKHELREKKEGQ